MSKKSSTMFYIQITSLYAGDRWHTLLICDDRNIAQKVADEMEVSDSPSTGGLRGVRNTRVMSRTQLKREGGWRAVEEAFDEEQNLHANGDREASLALRIWNRIIEFGDNDLAAEVDEANDLRNAAIESLA